MLILKVRNDLGHFIHAQFKPNDFPKQNREKKLNGVENHYRDLRNDFAS